ncbi:glucose-6-phosphate isomerase [Desulfovibrio sp. OttesenSCG-928-F07]|nr:glucose-6-phosphate isomerase [Desulfovibrio sp. OttesenSCG-928-F07]
MGANRLHWGQALRGRMAQMGDIWAQCAPLANKHVPLLKAELEEGRLPFIDMPYRDELEKELPLVMKKMGGHFKHMLLLGIGGSALGPRALQKAFMPGQDGPCHNGPWLWIADNVDAASLDAWLRVLPPKETLVVVTSKSGGTIETMSQYFIVREWLKHSLGSEWIKNVLAVTDATQGALRQEVNEYGFASLPVPDHLGGRFSVLSAVGMVPAYFCGIDWHYLLAGASGVFGPVAEDPATLGAHPAWRLALWNYSLMQQGYSQLIFFSYIPSWSCFGSWFGQLWAESLGKSGKGSMPLPATGVTDQHSLQQMFLDGPKDKACIFLDSQHMPKGAQFSANVPDKWDYLRGQHFGDVLAAETTGTLGAFAAADIPLVRINVSTPSEFNAGSLMALLELTTLFTGWLLELNPLDQPAVEYGKRLANARLGAKGYEQEQKDLQAFLGASDETQEF